MKNIKELLNVTKECSCGRKHSCDIGTVIIEKGAIRKIGQLTEGYHNILVVCDRNTYEVCGRNVAAQLAEKVGHVLVFQSGEVLVPNEDSIKLLRSHVTEETDLIVGVGSGVINDLCKYVSFLHDLPYMIVATATSMDGYASVGAAMIIGNMKITYNAHVPVAIIGDVDILKNAPMELIRSGYGDIIGKFSCLNDWKLSCVINGEYFCREVYDLTYEMLMETKDLGERLQKREEAAIEILMNALVGVGIAMAYAGNSRPASGSEHHLSHFFEVIGIMKKEPYFAHGTDVIYSAVYTQKLREELLSLSDKDVEKLTARIPAAAKAADACSSGAADSSSFDWTAWEQDIRAIYDQAAEGVIALQHKLDWYSCDNSAVLKERWKQIRDVLSEVPSSDTLAAYAESVGLDMAEFERLYGTEKINNALRYAKDLKYRYTVLWLYYFLKSRT